MDDLDQQLLLQTCILLLFWWMQKMLYLFFFFSLSPLFFVLLLFFDLCLPFFLCLSTQMEDRPLEAVFSGTFLLYCFWLVLILCSLSVCTEETKTDPSFIKGCLLWNLPFVFLLTCAYLLSAAYTAETLMEMTPLLRSYLFWNLPFVFLWTCAYPLSAVYLHRRDEDKPSFKKLFVLEPSFWIPL